MSLEKVIETDVLVIGGGMAGCFAAVKAKEKGVDVTLVDKGYVGKSGQTPFAYGYMIYHPERGHDLDAWMHQVNSVSEYVNNREWTEIGFKDSYARYQDLASWGVEFDMDDSYGVMLDLGPIRSIHIADKEPRAFAQIIRNHAVETGVEIMDRIMITELLRQDGRIVGAVGLPMDSDDLYIFKSKATVISAGAGAFKSAGWPTSQLTSDGDAMAYRVGAEITGKEFVDTHGTSAENPAHIPVPKSRRRVARRRPRMINAEGDEVPDSGMLFLDMEFEAHAGRAPITQEGPNGKSVRIGGAASGMSAHNTEGIWPADTGCGTSIPGLYAAGNALGTMQTGANYSAGGMAISGAGVTGARAGWSAAAYALKAEKPEVDKEELSRIKKIVYTPRERKGGFSPKWVTQLLQNAMIPYFIMYVKKEDRMKATLTLIEFMRDHLVPRLTAKDSHELRLALETRNMVLNAEMRLRASLFRTESRGSHYREDYPRRNDPDWLAWVLLKEENGEMKVFKKPIPEEWWPDLSVPYEERYPYCGFPGE